MRRLRGPVDEAGWIVQARFPDARKAPRRRATSRNSRSGNAAIGGEAPRIGDATSKAVHS